MQQLSLAFCLNQIGERGDFEIFERTEKDDQILLIYKLLLLTQKQSLIPFQDQLEFPITKLLLLHTIFYDLKVLSVFQYAIIPFKDFMNHKFYLLHIKLLGSSCSEYIEI